MHYKRRYGHCGVEPASTKPTKPRLTKLEVTEADRLIMEDQIQIEEENKVGDRQRAVAAPSQLTSISGISDKDRAGIASKKEEAIGTPNACNAGPSPVSGIRTNSQMKELTPKLANNNVPFLGATLGGNSLIPVP